MTNTERKKFLLIDGSSLLFRAFYAIRNLTTRDGIYTNGVYGFLNMYFKAVEMLEPDSVLVAFDRSAPTFRARDYEAYKANREETPTELAAQFGILKDVLDCLGVRHLDMEGYEADDILGTVAAEAEETFENYMLTGDRDYFQLVDDHTRVLFTKKGINELEVIDREKIREDYGLDPKQLIEVKGLQGDTSDNIPGVPGIGPKTAVRLIRDYGSIEGVYEHLDEISGKKLKENLVEYETQAYLSRKLGTIFTAVPLDDSLEDFKLGEPDREKLADRFERLEFSGFAKRFALEEKQESIEAECARAEDDERERALEEAREAGAVSFCVLSDAKSYLKANPLWLCLKPEGRAAVRMSLDNLDFGLIAALKDFFGDRTLKKRGYDIKENAVLLAKLGVELSEPYEDVMLMEYLLDPSRGSYDIAELAKYLFSRTVKSREDVLGKGAKRVEFDQVGEKEIDEYAGGMLSVVEKAAPILRSKMSEAGMERLFDEIENPLAMVLAHMEEEGVGCDRGILEELEVEFAQRLEALEQRIYDLAGETFNINSPKQLGDILFEKLGLPHGKKTKTGYSTSADILEKLADDHPIIGEILAYRQLAKLKSTYVDGLLSYIDEDGRVRSTFRQNVTATGRISSTEPNLQNIPVRTEEGRRLRAVFVAGKDRLLVDADYSQIELRVLASLSGDETMIEAFREGADIHRKTAAEVNHIPMEEVTPLERSRAKAVNFGIIYGISDFGLSRDLSISRDEAKRYIEKYKNTYPQIREYMKEIVAAAKRDGYVETYYGRRRYIPELSSKNFSIRQFGERIALNTPIQGTAADIIKIAMVKADKGLREGGFKSRLVLQIHDELIVESPKEEAEEVSRLLSGWMSEVGEFAVDLIVDCNIGKSWDDAK